MRRLRAGALQKRTTYVAHHVLCPARYAGSPNFGPPRRVARGAKRRVPAPWLGGVGAPFGVTPRQACPRPEGLRRNLRSKTRWFTGFCNSHQVSHFATFFIDARAEISVAESRVD